MQALAQLKERKASNMPEINHPISGEPLSFESEEKMIDWLLMEYTKRSNEEKIIGDEKRTFAKIIDSTCPDQVKLSGTVTLKGDDFVAKIVRGQTVKYATIPAGDDPLLQQVYTQIPESRYAISLKFVEKTAQMDRFLEDMPSPLNPQQEALVSRLLKERIFQSSSPQITVTINTDIP